jgi:hypothetical protein
MKRKEKWVEEEQRKGNDPILNTNDFPTRNLAKRAISLSKT